MSSNNSKQTYQLPTEVVAKPDDAYLSALSLCFSRIFPAILNAAIDLNLFEIIAEAQSTSCGASLSASEIASLLPNQHSELANRLDRILPVLASYSLLTCSIRTDEEGKRERVYALSPVGDYFVCDSRGGSFSSLSIIIHRGFQDVWNDIKDAIVDPSDNNHFQKVYGMSTYQYMETNEELNNIFIKAIAQISSLEMTRILKLYQGFKGVSTVVDVAGGVGQVLKQIISEHPSIKGINLDLPQVIQHAQPHPGIKHVGGDMFESVPEGDAILLKQVCHNWSDEECIKLLRNCHKALPEEGKVIIIEYIIPEVPDSSLISKNTCIADNFMFAVTSGKERTEKEFVKLCTNSGFSRFHVACRDLSVTSRVMEFYK